MTDVADQQGSPGALGTKGNVCDPGKPVVEFLSKDRVENIQNDILMVLKAVAAKHGLIINKQHINWTPDDAELKVRFAVEGGVPKHMRTYAKYRAPHNLPPVGTIVNLDGWDYKIEGMRVGGPHKSVILTKQADGKNYTIKLLGFKHKLGLP